MGINKKERSLQTDVILFMAMINMMQKFIVIIFKVMAIKIVVNEVEHFSAINFSLHFIRAFKLMASF